MVLKFVKRNDVKPLLPFDKFFCVDNRMGMFIGCLTTLFNNVFAWILVLLDLASWADFDFIIHGGFPAQWRRSFWKGFVAVDIVMVVLHLVIIIVTIVALIAILKPDRFKIYRLRPIIHAWITLMIMTVISEFGVSVYIYSWYGLAAWRRPYLIFTHVYYVVRFCLDIMFIVVAASYKAEMSLQLRPIMHDVSNERLLVNDGKSNYAYSNYDEEVYNLPDDINTISKA